MTGARTIAGEVTTRDVSLVSARAADGVLLHGTRVVVPGARVGLLGIHGAWGNFYANPTVPVVDGAVQRGYTAAAMNTRAHDLGSIGDGEPCHGFIRSRFEDCLDDLDAAADVLRDAGVSELVVVAHSYGCHKVTYWLHERRPHDVGALVMLSPSPLLNHGARWFVQGSVEHHLARAAAAVAAGQPERLIVLSHSAPVPMVVEAATALSVWGPDSLAQSENHVPHLDLPMYVTVGTREPRPYRDRAAAVAAAAGVDVVEFDDDHYYAQAPGQLAGLVLDWVDEQCRTAAGGLSGATR